ncbi:MAG: hypothetical protein U1A78_11895 [Polyangia bacterium]
MERTSWARLVTVTIGLGLCGSLSCGVELPERVPVSDGSFGATVFRETCQRLTYSADLADAARGGSRPLDVSGSSRRALCRGEVAPSPDEAPSVRALFSQRDNVLVGVDTGIPDRPVDLQAALDGYLRALAPLQDDGTLPTILARTGGVLQRLAGDAPALAAAARLGHLGGVRPAATAGGLVRALSDGPALDELSGAALPLLDVGGPAAADLQALLRAGAFTLRHLEPSQDPPLDPERTPAVLRRLLVASHPDLREQRPLGVALRDPRGLPQLAEVVPPYVAEPSGLARADSDGYFLDAGGQRIAYVPPLPEPGAAATGARDPLGRALRADGKLLYAYADLDGSLLAAALAMAPRLLDDAPVSPGGPARDPLFGLLRGAALVAGSRIDSSRQRGGETLAYRGFSAADSPLLDLVHGAAQLLRFQPLTAGLDLADALRGARTLLADPTLQGRLARATKALLDAADEARRPAYDGARLPTSSTLYDDLVPIVQRLLAVDNGLLAEDVVAALGDEHTRNLGPILAHLADERGYFFMRPVNSTEGLADLPRPCMPPMSEEVNGLLPCGVLGSLGNRPDRGAPDSDATLDWRGPRTSDPQNNRSVLQRLLHLVADSNNGRPFCNGRGASVFGGLVRFDDACDMFEVTSVARFFLLSLASPALRDRADTYAKPAASFREAIKNGRLCRGATPDPMGKCAGLLTTIDDGTNGDRVLEGMMGVLGFGRYPEPAAAARALFMDLSGATTGAPKRAQDLVYNHVAAGTGFTVDPVDPDERKFRDGTGTERRFIDEHNGVLFALEKVHAPATLPDGSPNKYPSDTFYDAIRPLVDAFARHAECAARDAAGACTRFQNATQILADAMTVLHRHYPSARSQRFGRGFVGSYGPQVSPDGAVSYEPLLVPILSGDLLPASAELAPVLSGLTVDGQAASRRVLPIFVQLGRFAFDASVGGSLSYRDPAKKALRNDGMPAGPVTVFYLLADALKQAREILDRPENQAHKAAWTRSRSDALDALLKVTVSDDGMGGRRYAFDEPRLRPVAVLGLDFLIERVLTHGKDAGGPSAWIDSLESDAADLVTGPVLPPALDVATKLASEPRATAATYALLRQVLAQPVARQAVAALVLDGVQLLLDDADLVPLGRAVAALLEPDSGPALPAVTLLRRGRELEQASELVPAPKMTAVRLLGSLYRPDGSGVYPMSRLADAIAEVDRAHPDQGPLATGPFTAADYRALFTTAGGFLVDEQRGLMRFLRIVQSRCLAGSTRPGCPAAP